MSGIKRRSNYRKSVTQSFLDDLPLPEEDEFIAKINHSRGGNIFEVTLQTNEVSLALLPTKFKKLIWMKRGDFVILSKAERDVEVTTGKSAGVKYLIQHILNEEQIKNIKKEKKWPENWPQSEVKSLEEKKEKEKEIDSMDEDIAENEEEEEEDEFLDMGYNPNRRARTYSE